MADNTPMTLERAIQTAIEYETNVRDLYQDAADKATEEVGKKIFEVLAKEEQGHLDYLISRFDEWERTGTIESPALATLLPSREQIAAGVDKLGKTIETVDWSVELDLLRKALIAEGLMKAYQAEVDDPPKVTEFFERLAEWESGHCHVLLRQHDELKQDYWSDGGFSPF
jgi:rubrerythrin